jgi:succinoglycan biosynthesis transport protein ExoP
MNIKPLSQSEGPQSISALPAWFARIDILQSLQLHKMLATLVALGTLGLGFAMLARHHSTFKATSVVYVSPNFPASLVTNQEQEYHYDSYIEEQLHLVKRYAVISGAVRKLNPGVWQHPGENLDSAVERLQNSLTVKRDGQSYQVDITLQGGNPRYLAAIVNAVTDSYLDEVKDEEFYGRDERLDSLRQARVEVQAQLTSRLQEQTQISQALGVAVVSADSDQIDTQVAKLQTDLMAAHEQRIEAQAKLDALENGGRDVPSAALNAAAEEIIASDPSLLALKSSLSQKRALLLDQLAGMTANHPLRKTTEEQLSQIESALQKLQTNLRDHAAASLEQKLRTDLKRAGTVEGQLRSDLQSNTHQATLAAPSFQRAQVLKAEITALQARYATLDEQTRNLELESKSPGSVHLFAAAQVPTGPLATKNKLYLRLLLPFALLLATLTVVLVDLLDRRVQAAIDVEQLLGFAPIAAIFDDQDVSMQVSDECTLRLAASVDQAARTAGVRTILLTSLNTGGGTTSIVENLGSTLAKLGRRTLTIDSTGASLPIAYVTHNSNHVAQLGTGGFSAMRPGADIRSTAVVAQQFSTKLTPLTNFMDQTFKDLTTDYDIVLIDATPILMSAETEYLARFADVTILIAEAGKTTKAQLVRASRLLERLQVPGIAAIINKIAYRRASRATREDISALEARMKKEGFRWTSPWRKPGVPAHDDVDQAAKEDATYA